MIDHPPENSDIQEVSGNVHAIPVEPQPRKRWSEGLWVDPQPDVLFPLAQGMSRDNLRAEIAIESQPNVGVGSNQWAENMTDARGVAGIHASLDRFLANVERDGKLYTAGFQHGLDAGRRERLREFIILALCGPALVILALIASLLGR